MIQTNGRARGIILLKIAIILVCASFSIGCASGEKPQPESYPDKQIKTLLVVPFKNQSLLRGEGAFYRCSLCGGMFTTSRVEKGADAYVTDDIVGLLDARQKIALIPNDQVDTVRRQILLGHESTPSELVLLTEIGRKLGADAVLTGSVYKFIQRAGSDFAADSPASVGIDFDLIDTRTGELAWHTRFDETQEHLTDNFLKIFTFFRRGGKWVTAEQLAASGIKKVLEGSPIP